MIRDNPNTTRLKELQSNLDREKDRYNRYKTNKTFIILRFLYDRQVEAWQSKVLSRSYRITFKANNEGGEMVARRPDCRYVCERQSLIVDSKPKIGRKGYKLLLVKVIAPYIDPEAEIKMLETEIAAGNL